MSEKLMSSEQTLRDTLERLVKELNAYAGKEGLGPHSLMYALTQAETALAQPTGSQPPATLLRKLAASWIETGQNGTGLRKDGYVEQHQQAIQGIYEYCGKSLLEYLDYSPKQPTAPAVAPSGDKG